MFIDSRLEAKKKKTRKKLRLTKTYKQEISRINIIRVLKINIFIIYTDMKYYIYSQNNEFKYFGKNNHKYMY